MVTGEYTALWKHLESQRRDKTDEVNHSRAWALHVKADFALYRILGITEKNSLGFEKADVYKDFWSYQ